ncbi:MAG: ASCH domain-containing protein [Planctomycetota bacterium]
MGNYHLVILKRPYLHAILEGRKKVESRFTMTRRAYFGRVLPGDTLFLKESSGPVCGMATVEAVRSFENLTPERISRIKQKYNSLIGGSEDIWRSKADCGFGMLVWLKDVEAVEPVRIPKKDWRAWVVLTNKEHFGLLERGRIKTIEGGLM